MASIEALDYPANRIECIVVDNGSVDGSSYFVKQAFPKTRTLSLGKNVGYASAINAGAEMASGEILFFLNNDAIAKNDCLINLVKPISSGETDCTSAKIVDTSSKYLQFAGGGMNFHGIAYQVGENEQDKHNSSTPVPTLFPCGAAMAIRKDIFTQVGGMDDAFFAYFEDVDLGWRLWLLGYKVTYVPEAVASHSQSETSRFIDLSKIRVLHIRNPLMMIYKNYSDSYLSSIMPVAWMLTARRTLNLSSLDPEPFRIDNEPQLAETAKTDVHALGMPQDKTALPTVSVSDFFALNDWLNQFTELKKKRAEIQKARVRPDSEITPMFKDPFRYSEYDESYKLLQDELCDSFGVNNLFNKE